MTMISLCLLKWLSALGPIVRQDTGALFYMSRRAGFRKSRTDTVGAGGIYHRDRMICLPPQGVQSPGPTLDVLQELRKGTFGALPMAGNDCCCAGPVCGQDGVVDRSSP